MAKKPAKESLKETFNDVLIQIYYKLDIKGGINREWIDLAEEKKILPEFLAWYSPTWFAKRFPHNADDLPKGVTPAQHFVTFDPKKGLLLCVGYYFDETLLVNDREFKSLLEEIVDDARGQFADGWGEGFEQRDFKIGRKNYSPDPTSNVVYIVSPIEGDEAMMIRWNSIAEIKNVEWMRAYNNDIWNILYNLKKHKEKKEAAHIRSWGDELEMYEFVEKNKDKFFFAY